MQIHVVQTGQTLFSIGMEYGIPAGLIARYNGLREPYRLAVGQSLLILRPEAVYTVREGDTLASVSREFGVPILQLLQNNPNLNGSAQLFPGQTLVLRLETKQEREISVSGYAYPYVSKNVLRGILPYTTWLAPFTYGFSSSGELLAPDDAALITLARAYSVGALLHLSTLTERGNFSAERASVVFSAEPLSDELAKNTAQQMADGSYVGVDVDFEFLGAPLSQAYVDFLAVLHEEVRAQGGILLSALAPKTYAEQPGILYEGHDYAGIGKNSDIVLVMTYEWGYTYGPPMAVAPLGSVRRVLDYAVSEVPAEKLLLGFPNYAYDWALPYKAGDSRAELIGNEAAIQRAIAFGAEIRFDETSQAPYYYYTAQDGIVHEVWFEDARSSLAKYNLISEYNLRGVGFWNYMRPFTAGFSLLNYLYSIERGLP